MEGNAAMLGEGRARRKMNHGWPPPPPQKRHTGP